MTREPTEPFNKVDGIFKYTFNFGLIEIIDLGIDLISLAGWLVDFAKEWLESQLSHLTKLM